MALPPQPRFSLDLIHIGQGSHGACVSEDNNSRQKTISLVLMALVKPVLVSELYLSRAESFAFAIDLCLAVVDRARYSLSFALSGSERYRVGIRER